MIKKLIWFLKKLLGKQYRIVFIEKGLSNNEVLLFGHKIYVRKGKIMMNEKYIEDALKRHEEWLSKHDKIYGEIKELAIQTARMVDEVKHLREEQNELKNRVNEIEEKPVKRYDNIVMQIITFFIGAILTIIAVKIGLK